MTKQTKALGYHNIDLGEIEKNKYKNQNCIYLDHHACADNIFTSPGHNSRLHETSTDRICYKYVATSTD